MNTGHCNRTLHGHTDRVWSIAFSPDGTILASGSTDRTICLWEVSTSRCLSILHGHTNRIRSFVFSPAGKTLASGSDDGTIKLWDIEAAECLKTLISERPYERMNITKVSGLTEAQKATLKVLGAIENE
jgi:WD40 repeat protein